MRIALFSVVALTSILIPACCGKSSDSSSATADSASAPVAEAVPPATSVSPPAQAGQPKAAVAPPPTAGGKMVTFNDGGVQVKTGDGVDVNTAKGTTKAGGVSVTGSKVVVPGVGTFGK